MGYKLLVNRICRNLQDSVKAVLQIFWLENSFLLGAFRPRVWRRSFGKELPMDARQQRKREIGIV